MAKVIPQDVLNETERLPEPTSMAALNRMSDMTMQRTIVEAFVKMVVCRRVTVQRVALTGGQVLDSHTTQEEDSPVILDVTRHETSDICAQSTSNHRAPSGSQSHNVSLSTSAAASNSRSKGSDSSGRDGGLYSSVGNDSGTDFPDTKHSTVSNSDSRLLRADNHTGKGTASSPFESDTSDRTHANADPLKMDFDSNETESVAERNLTERNDNSVSLGDSMGLSLTPENSHCGEHCEAVQVKTETQKVTAPADRDTEAVEYQQSKDASDDFDSAQGLGQVPQVISEGSGITADCDVEPCHTLLTAEGLSSDVLPIVSHDDSGRVSTKSDQQSTTGKVQSPSSGQGGCKELRSEDEGWVVQLNTDAASTSNDDTEMAVSGERQGDKHDSDSDSVAISDEIFDDEKDADSKYNSRTSSYQQVASDTSRSLTDDKCAYGNGTTAEHRGVTPVSTVTHVSGDTTDSVQQHCAHDLSMKGTSLSDEYLTVTHSYSASDKPSSSPESYPLQFRSNQGKSMQSDSCADRLDPFAHLFESSFPPLDKAHDSIVSEASASEKRSCIRGKAQSTPETRWHQTSGNVTVISSGVKEEPDDDCMITAAYNITPTTTSSHCHSDRSMPRGTRGSTHLTSPRKHSAVRNTAENVRHGRTDFEAMDTSESSHPEAGYSDSATTRAAVSSSAFSTDREAIASASRQHIPSSHHPNFLPPSGTTNNNVGHDVTSQSSSQGRPDLVENVLCVECGQDFSSSEKLFSHVCVSGESSAGQTSNATYLQAGEGSSHPAVGLTSWACHVCPVCSKRFWSKQTFRQHMTIHTGQRQFGCHICTKRFKQRAHLATHLKFHMGVKRYRCEQCSQAYVQKGDLVRHLRSRAHGINTALSSD